MFAVLRRWRSPVIDEERWLVLDVEASGLDVRRDRLIAIAAVAVRTVGTRPSIHLADSFEAVLQQPGDGAPPDKANILLHGIGVGAQRAGLPPRQALAAFAAFAAGSPLLAFHAAFDRGMLRRAWQAAALPPLPNPWLDLAPLAGVLHPREKARSLDEWMARFGIRCAVRHQAAADALATAELLLKLWPALRAQQPQPRFAAAAALAAQQRWVQT